MTLAINTQFEVMSDFDLQFVEGGTFWGVVGGGLMIVGAVGAATVSVALALVPSPDPISKYGSYASGGVAVALAIGGLATIANNL